VTFTPPQSLIDEILSGNCIAFVGAGFSAAANLPQWGPLLLEMASSGNADPSVAAHIEERVACGTAHALDEAAQALEDAIGRAQLVASLCRQLGHPAPTQEIRDRVRFLRGIPFRAVLTTNFDSVLTGSIPNPDAYRSVLRPEGFGWWERRYWKGDDGAFTLKLHGDLSIGETDAAEIVLTRRYYRRRTTTPPTRHSSAM